MDTTGNSGDHINVSHHVVPSSPTVPPVSSSFAQSPKFRQFLRWVCIFLLGQFMSFNVATSGVFITFLVRTNSSLPMVQAVSAYSTITIVFGFVYFIVVFRNRKEIDAAYKIEYYDDEPTNEASYDSCAYQTDTQQCRNKNNSHVSNDAGESSTRCAKCIKWCLPRIYYHFKISPSLSPFFFSSTKRNNGKTFRGVCKGLWRFAFIAIIDLQATYCIVSAYNYTDMTSIQLLDCSTIIFCIIFSYLFLKGVNYHFFWHIIGAAIALGGIIFLIEIDSRGKARSGGDDDSPVRTKKDIILGDCLTIIASLFYAMSNVATEKLVTAECGKEGDAVKLIAGHIGEEISASGSSELEVIVLLPQPAPPPPPPSSIPSLRSVVIIEYLFWMPLCGAIFSTIQFLALQEYKDIAFYTHTSAAFQDVANGTSYADIAWLGAFCVCMLIMYVGFPCLFLVAGATFANLSLLTSDVFSLMWNEALFKLKPNSIFFVAFSLILSGVIIFDTDGFKALREWCKKRFSHKVGGATENDASHDAQSIDHTPNRNDSTE